MLGSTRIGQHPRATCHRRLMPHMLPMSARQVGDPVALLILMVSDDLLLHHCPSRQNATVTRQAPQFAVRSSLFIEQAFGSRTDWEKRPRTSAVDIERPLKSHPRLQRPELDQFDTTALFIEAADIELSHHKETP